MESLTKNRQTNQTLEDMLEAAFGKKLKIGDGESEVRICELKEGFFNVAYEICMPEQTVILKIAPPSDAKIMSYEKNMMEAEVNALRLAKKKTSVPVPQIFYYDNSHLICQADYFFMEKLQGNSYFQSKNDGLNAELQQKIMQDLGRYNREINEITGDVFGYFGLSEIQGTEWQQVFGTMVEMVLKDGEAIGIEIGCPYQEVRDILERAKGSLTEVTTPKLVHWDLWEGNVFVQDGIITGLIDFERSMWADPLMEYFFRAHSYHPDFTEGYGEDLRAKYPIRANLYDLYLYLIMVIETDYRCYPDDWQYNFASEQLRYTLERLQSLV
ncbi:MAG: aminoglycoside phosphotransferase [Herbinix sp.]|jgi:aminoglycoside phosphotransferase (APT) family kinase protein|nr:aminoglycoside phosphotransferase [Herbinix sp.]